MSKVPWSQLQDLQPKAHLLVGLMPPDRSFGNGEIRAFQNVLLRLIRQHQPSGRYAAAVVRDDGRPEAYFAFENEMDADALAAVVKATATRLYSGWASRRAFRLEGPAVSAIESTLPPAMTRAWPKRGDEPTRRAIIPRGPRAPL